nr:hypothetical protein [uncultured Campylobacter sp.]
MISSLIAQRTKLAAPSLLIFGRILIKALRQIMSQTKNLSRIPTHHLAR